MQERLQKIMAAAGVASRRGCENLIREGRVTVNGQPAGLGDKADQAKDTIAVDGAQLPPPATLTYIILNKPRGYASTREDPHAKKTVLDLLPERFAHLYPVGRLDVRSEGLLLLTNDGDLANRLAHPRYGVTKTYHVTVNGVPSGGEMGALRSGVELEDGLARPKDVSVLGCDTARGRTRLRITMTEGRNREVRRMLDAVRHEVVRLVRVEMGPLEITGLKPGEWRELTPGELSALTAFRKRSRKPAS